MPEQKDEFLVGNKVKPPLGIKIISILIFLISFFMMFGVLEIIAYIIGSFFKWSAQCSACIWGEQCYPCPDGDYSAYFLYIAIIPNLILAFIIVYFVRKYKNKK